MPTPKSIFRKKFDGSFDSICMTCLQTVAANTEQESNRQGREHVCVDSPLAQAAGERLHKVRSGVDRRKAERK